MVQGLSHHQYKSVRQLSTLGRECDCLHAGVAVAVDMMTWEVVTWAVVAWTLTELVWTAVQPSSTA